MTESSVLEKQGVDWALIHSEIDKPVNENLLKYLKELSEQGYKITEIFDEKDFNLLHHAVLKGHPGKVHFLIETAKQLD